MRVNPVRLGKDPLSVKKRISWRGSEVFQGLEEQLESSQDSPEAGNFTNRIDLAKLPLAKDKKCAGQSDCCLGFIYMQWRDRNSHKASHSICFFLLTTKEAEMTILCCTEATFKGLNLCTGNATLNWYYAMSFVSML